MFCSVLIGVGIALFVTPRLEKDYLRRAAAKGGRADPEDRLIGMMIGCWFIPIGGLPASLFLMYRVTKGLAQACSSSGGRVRPRYSPVAGIGWVRALRAFRLALEVRIASLSPRA